MKFHLFFSACISMCSSSSFPIIIGDNSHYVEGVSRYIWMPDSNGVPYLIDLQIPINITDQDLSRSGENNQYLLYTRLNPYTPQYLYHNDIQSVAISNFDPRRPVTVIVHGWRSSGLSEMPLMITDAFLRVMDCNVIVVDWSAASSSITYILSVYRVPSVGEFLGDFLIWLLKSTGVSWNNLHLVGFSLGAHVVGNAGRRAYSLPKRITGLDPAGPTWSDSPNRLNAYDGQYVEVIHTDGGSLGIFDPIGAVNFYPNGGKNTQPGCWLNFCSHSRAYKLFASSIVNNHLLGFECDSLSQVKRNQCFGDPFPLGNADLTKRGFGIYGLITDSSWPY